MSVSSQQLVNVRRSVVKVASQLPPALITCSNDFLQGDNLPGQFRTNRTAEENISVVDAHLCHIAGVVAYIGLQVATEQ